jgi:cell division septum initiation protein DivIVA
LKNIEDKFVDKFNDIKLENTQLRGRILKLSQDISKYQSHLTKINYKGKAYVSQHERMQAVLRACNSANLSLIKVASDVVSTEIRKCSTPETKGEKMQALAIKRDEL